MIHANESLQGLTLYGDDKNLITWGVKGKQLQLKFIKENSESILYESGAVDKDIYLKIEVEQGCIFNFYKSKDGKIWNPILDTPLKGESLIRSGQGGNVRGRSLWSERGSGGICLFQNDKPEIDETHEE